MSTEKFSPGQEKFAHHFMKKMGEIQVWMLQKIGGRFGNSFFDNSFIWVENSRSEYYRARLAAVAWDPATPDQITVRAVFVNQEGEILRSTTARYSGDTSIPPAGCAMVGTASPETIIGGRLARNGEAGSDGNTWRTLQ